MIIRSNKALKQYKILKSDLDNTQKEKIEQKEEKKVPKRKAKEEIVEPVIVAEEISENEEIIEE